MCSFEQNRCWRVRGWGPVNEYGEMITRDYFARKAVMLLQLARITKDQNAHAVLTAKAADVKEHLDTVPRADDLSPLPPDVDATRSP